jgi:hypothetical protein
MSERDEPKVSPEEIAARRARQAAAADGDRVVFKVSALYGLSKVSVRLPLNEKESIESGQVCVTIDPDASPVTNLGVIDYAARELKVRYGAHMVFPGLYELVTTGRFDPALLRPVRATATDECRVSEDYRGWRALGCLDFLPGSLWAGASGG